MISIHKKLVLLLVVVALFCCSDVFAFTLVSDSVATDSIKKKTTRTDPLKKQKDMITKVKRNPDAYLWAEVTCKTAQEAKELTQEMIYGEISRYVDGEKTKSSKDYIIQNLKSISTEISMPRGSNMHRHFIYVKKSDIKEMKNSVLLSQMAQGQMGGDTPPLDNALVENQENDNVDTLISVVEPVFSEDIKQLSQVHNINQANQVLKRLKSMGKVKAIARYSQVENPQEWFLLIYNKDGEIKALLSDGANRFNVGTATADDVKNYPQHAALAIKF